MPGLVEFPCQKAVDSLTHCQQAVAVDKNQDTGLITTVKPAQAGLTALSLSVFLFREVMADFGLWN